MSEKKNSKGGPKKSSGNAQLKDSFEARWKKPPRLGGGKKTEAEDGINFKPKPQKSRRSRIAGKNRGRGFQKEGKKGTKGFSTQQKNTAERHRTNETEGGGVAGQQKEEKRKESGRNVERTIRKENQKTTNGGGKDKWNQPERPRGLGLPTEKVQSCHRMLVHLALK